MRKWSSGFNDKIIVRHSNINRFSQLLKRDNTWRTWCFKACIKNFDLYFTEILFDFLRTHICNRSLRVAITLSRQLTKRTKIEDNTKHNRKLMVIDYGLSVSLTQIMHSFRCETTNGASTLNLSQYLDVFVLHFVSWVPIHFSYFFCTVALLFLLVWIRF